MAPEASSWSPANQPHHAVCFPYPVQSHIAAMLNFAKLLHARGGISITFVNTEFNHRRLLEASDPTFLDNLPNNFRFMAIPDGLPVSKANTTQDLVDLCRSARYLMGAPFCALVEDLNEKAVDHSISDFPPVSCIVADCLMTFSAHHASQKFGIPIVNLFTIPA